MSQYFYAGERMIWNSPGVLAGTLFAAMAEVLSAQLKVPSGVSVMFNDECRIDGPVFETFVQALLDRDFFDNSWFWSNLMPGYVLTAWILLERSGGTVQEPDYDRARHPGALRSWWAHWIERHDEAIENEWIYRPVE